MLHGPEQLSGAGTNFTQIEKDLPQRPLLNRLGWFSVGICKYKPGYKSHDLL